ncbi:hypothetical protein PRIC1_003390 [Phytophthora ramorum]
MSVMPTQARALLLQLPTNASEKPTSATEIQTTKVTATIPAAPTQVVSLAGKNTTKKANMNSTGNTNMLTKSLVLAEITVSSIHKAGVKREHVDQWVSGAVNPKTLTCIQEIQETQQALLETMMKLKLTILFFLQKFGDAVDLVTPPLQSTEE